MRMDLKEAIMARHSVRTYLDKPIAETAVATLREAIKRINADNGLNIQLVQDEPKAFSSGMWKYGQFSGVKNYFVMAGYTQIDLGIVKYHFEVGAGKDNFTWI